MLKNMIQKLKRAIFTISVTANIHNIQYPVYLHLNSRVLWFTLKGLEKEIEGFPETIDIRDGSLHTQVAALAQRFHIHLIDIKMTEDVLREMLSIKEAKQSEERQ